MAEPVHIPVLLEQVLASLAPAAGETYVDATAGLGGHALEVGRVIGAGGTIVLNDVDPANLGEAERRIRGALGEGTPRLIALRGNFADLPRRLIEVGVAADLFLADLGFSSNQMAEGGRGFSFQHDAPLDMRLDPTLPTSAADLVASLPVPELARILSEYGEERQAGRIARKLAEARVEQPITSTTRLAEIVRRVVARPGASDGGIDPATRTFQALRIAVNDELGVLESLLESIAREGRRLSERAMGGGRTDTGWLRSDARVGIISFHSLEDRPVKRCFADLTGKGQASTIGARLQRPDEEELDSNRRSRSARLRAVRIGEPGAGSGA